MATIYDLTLEQGTSEKLRLQFQRLTDPYLDWHATSNPYLPFDLTDCTIAMMVRASYDAKTPVLSIDSTTGDTPKIVITDAEDGIAEVRLDPSDTSSIKFTGESFEGVYDIEVDDGVSVERAFQGACTISREVTRS